MGLDMYLEARKYVSKVANWREEEVELSEDYKKVSAFFPDWAIDPDGHAGAEVSISFGYWRKANQIHNWFIQNCADGVDECQPIGVSADKLRELRATVQHVLDSRSEAEAKKLLAPSAGFFFGTYDIDEYYWSDLERTVEILNKAVRLAEDEQCGIIYQASW